MTASMKFLRGKCKTKTKDLNVICCYAPTEDSDENEKDTFYSQLQDILNSVEKGYISLMLGDFNGKIGTDSDLWAGVLGFFGIDSSNGNGERLLQESRRESYEKLKINVMQKANADYNKIIVLKKYFETEIDSMRTLSRIQTVRDLICELEEKDSIHECNVKLLYELGEKLNNQEICLLVKLYQKIHADENCCICNEKDALLIFNNTLNSSYNDDIPLEKLSQRLGCLWPHLMRALDVRERLIDEIRGKYFNPEEQAQKVLCIWVEQYGGTRQSLENALENRLCKRAGLGKHILETL